MALFKCSDDVARRVDHRGGVSLAETGRLADVYSVDKSCGYVGDVMNLRLELLVGLQGFLDSKLESIDRDVLTRCLNDDRCAIGAFYTHSYRALLVAS